MALSIRQPWAWLIVRPDLQGDARAAALGAGEIKTIENRTWFTRHRGPLLLHASKGMTRAEYEGVLYLLSTWGGPPIALPAPRDLQRGGIVGRATLVDCIPWSRRESRWHAGGQYGFALADIEPLPLHPCPGALGFFDVPWPPPQ